MIDAQSMIVHLKELFDAQGKTKKYETSKGHFRRKMATRVSMGVRALKVIRLIKKLAQLGYV